MKSELELSDILQLEMEINGFVDEITKEVIYSGFMNQNLPIILKYDLNDLSIFLRTEKEKVDKLRNELIRKYGKDDGNGNLVVQMYHDKKDENGNVLSRIFDDDYLKFEKEYNELLSKKIKIEYPEITKNDLKEAGSSKDKYIILFKLIKKEEVK